MICPCNGCAGHNAWKADKQAGFETWLAAQADPNDLTYAEAVVARKAREAGAMERFEAMVTRQDSEWTHAMTFRNEKSARYFGRVR